VGRAVKFVEHDLRSYLPRAALSAALAAASLAALTAALTTADLPVLSTTAAALANSHAAATRQPLIATSTDYAK